MGQHIHIVIHIAVAAVGAGVGRITLRRTGGRGYRTLIGMGHGFHIISLTDMAAAGAGIGGIALRGAGGRGYNCGIRVTQRCPDRCRAVGQTVGHGMALSSGTLIAQQDRAVGKYCLIRNDTVCAVNIDLLQRGAVQKCPALNLGNTGRDRQGCQTAAVGERVVTDDLHTFRNGDFLQIIAVIEDHRTKFCQAIRNVCIFQRAAAGERIISDGSHAVRDLDALQL